MGLGALRADLGAPVTRVRSTTGGKYSVGPPGRLRGTFPGPTGSSDCVFFRITTRCILRERALVGSSVLFFCASAALGAGHAFLRGSPPPAPACAPGLWSAIACGRDAR